MAPKNMLKKKIQMKNKKTSNKVAKKVAKPIKIDNNSNDDSDGSLDAIEFNSKYTINIIV